MAEQLAVKIEITGSRGSGKTTLAEELFTFFRERNNPVVVNIASLSLLPDTKLRLGLVHEGTLILSTENKLHEQFTQGG